MRPEIPTLEEIRHVHLVAVAGTAMGSLACMFQELGLRVSGSDVDTYPPMSELLRDAGVPVMKGFTRAHVLSSRPDLVVIGNAVRSDNPEARAVLEAGIPYVSLPEAIAHFFLRGKHSVVVAGTHGKTTTTSLIGHLLTHAGRDPTILIGGVAENLGSSFRLGEGEHFVIEGDEYDSAFFDKTPKFRHYEPRSLLLTSCEFDHADIYASLDEIRDVFRGWVDSLSKDTRIVYFRDSQAVRDIVREARGTVEGFGCSDDSVWRATDVSFDSDGTQFNVWRGEERLGSVRAPLFGRHNVENLLSAVAIAIGLGLTMREIAAALREFKGVRRRQEIRGEEAGVCVIEDFAHHPTAVRATLSALRVRFPDRRLWAVLEPRTNTSRRRFFEEAYAGSLALADCAILAGVYRPEQIPEEERFRPEQVVAEIARQGTQALHLPGPDEIIEWVVRNRSGRDVVVIMSNGSFGGIWDRLLAELRRSVRGGEG